MEHTNRSPEYRIRKDGVGGGGGGCGIQDHPICQSYGIKGTTFELVASKLNLRLVRICSVSFPVLLLSGSGVKKKQVENYESDIILNNFSFGKVLTI
jgi:hypothetical protein